MNTIIRPATTEDIQLINDMAQIAFRTTYREMLSPEQIDYMMDWMYSLPSLEKQMAQGHSYFLAYLNEAPCGYISIEGNKLQKLYVLPDHQGKGLGKVLFEYATAHLRSKGAKSMILNVNRDNKAVEFYKKMGMSILSRGDFHIGSGYYMNDYIMSLDLL